MEALFFNQKSFFPSRNIEIFVFLFSPLFSLSAVAEFTGQNNWR